MMTNNDIKRMLEFMDNYTVAKENLVMKIVNKVNIIPVEYSVPLEDLSIVFRLKLDEGKLIKVNKAIVNSWKVDAKTLINDALVATKKNDPLMLQTLPGVLGSMFWVYVEENSNVYVVTTESMVGGAVALFYPETIIKLMTKLNTNKLLIIPSSIHEFLVMPFGDIDTDYINNTIKEVNETQVLPEERLADHAYVYGFDEGKPFFVSL